MADVTGRFIWYEVMTTDVAAAREFYTQVVGWTAADSEMPGMEYWLFKAGETSVAGLMKLPDEVQQMGVPPHWMGYVGVADVDAAVAQVAEQGGEVHQPPMEIPNVGRFAVVADPFGAAIGLFQTPAGEEGGAQTQEGEGHVGWNELHGGEVEGSFAFYADLFGWEKIDAMDMGEMGVYQVFGLGETHLGGMMKNPPESPAPPHWNYYFNVGNIDAAVERVKAAGGQVLMDPMEVPGGEFVIMGMDPQGAAFALVGKR